MGKEGIRTLLLDACPSIDFSNGCGFPNDCYNHTELYKVTPYFFGNDGDSVTHHIVAFFKLVANDLIIIFSFSLKGDAENWSYDLTEKSIVSMVDIFECLNAI